MKCPSCGSHISSIIKLFFYEYPKCNSCGAQLRMSGLKEFLLTLFIVLGISRFLVWNTPILFRIIIFFFILIVLLFLSYFLFFRIDPNEPHKYDADHTDSQQ
jgi:hypothetical protein